MNPLSFLEKWQMVWSVINSSPLYAIALIIVVFLIYLLATTNRSNKKESRKVYILLYIAAFIFLAIQYGSSFMQFIDYIINQVFIGYYFPTIMIYLVLLIITNIIVWKSIFSDITPTVIKFLNSFVFGILIYLFILILSLIDQLKLNAFNLEELYQSNQVRSILELSTFIFTIWVLVLIVYSLIRKYLGKRKVVKEEIKPVHVEIPIQPKVEFEEKSINNITPTITEPFTLEEYKMMSKILKEQHAKEQETSLEELNQLYKSVNL